MQIISDIPNCITLTRKYEHYSPIIKEKGFNPSPVAGKIPHWANSLTNPSCVGTRDYEEFWEEQIYYCYHGYTTGGIWLPGKYYDYLNFSVIDGVGIGKNPPWFIDLHYQIFRLEDEIRNDYTVAGGTFPKARRKGLSFFEKQLMSYGMRFIDCYRAGAAAGLKRFTEGLQSKLYRTYNNCPPEMQLNHLTKGDNEFLLGWEEKTKEKGFQRDERAMILFATMEDDSKKFEGEFFHDYFSEETGEFKLAAEAAISIGPNLKDGEKYVGKMWFPGTGGNMAKGGKTFATIYHQNESLDLVNMFIPGKRFYEPYVVIPAKETVTPYLDEQYHDLSPEQILGCEDVKAAQESLDRTKAKLARNPDKKKLIQHLQNYPDKVEDVFTSSGSNNFDNNLLYGQNFIIDSLANPLYHEFVLDFVKDETGNFATPLAVKCRPAVSGDKPWNIVKIWKHPDRNYKDLDVIGVDGYNEDQTLTSDSIGAIVGIRRYDTLNDPNCETPGRTPIFLYNARPPRKEIFWDIALKLAIYYDTIGNTMIAAEADLIIKHFIDMNCRRYLAKRPVSFDSPHSKKIHPYGCKMDNYTKPRMVSIMQTWVVDCIKYCWFKDINNDLIAYDDTKIGTDWDTADALGLALIRIEDMKKKPTEESQEEEADDDIPEWDHNTGTVARVKRTHKKVERKKEEAWKDLPNPFTDDLDPVENNWF